MKKEKKLPQRAAAMNDDIFLAMLSAKSDARVKARRLAAAQAKIELLEAARLEEQRAAKQELDGMVAFVGVACGLVVIGACILAAPVWTVSLPILGTLAIMRKAGWI